jgi:hypothetical protein
VGLRAVRSRPFELRILAAARPKAQRAPALLDVGIGAVCDRVAHVAIAIECGGRNSSFIWRSSS